MPDANAGGHKVLLWGRNAKCNETSELQETRALLFDQDYDPDLNPPNAHGLSLTANDATDFLLCAGHAFMADGQLLVAGGELVRFNYQNGNTPVPCLPHTDCANSDGGTDGIRKLFSFSPTWQERQSMWSLRWYPSVLRLSDGRMFVAGGDTVLATNCSKFESRTPEFYLPEPDFVSSSKNEIVNIDENYPFVYPAPRGDIFYGNKVPKAMNITTQVWSEYTPEPRLGWDGSAVAYAAYKVLRCGGFREEVPNGPDLSQNSVFVADMTQYLATPSADIDWAQKEDMLQVRSQHNLVVVPTGHVLAFGGGCGDADDALLQNDGDPNTNCDENRVVEQYNASFNSWSTLAEQPTLRSYHSTATLLYDGRVLVAGGGYAAGRPDRPSAEIFSPPYLFKANGTKYADSERVICANSPALNAEYGTTLSVPFSGPQPTKAALMGLGAVTHSGDLNQRRLPVLVSVSSYDAGLSAGVANVTAPALPDSAPPGYYMLFLWHELGGRQVMGKAAYVKLSDGRMLGSATHTWTGIGASLQPPDTNDHWSKLVRQPDNQVYQVNTTYLSTPNAVIEAVGKIQHSTAIQSVLSLDLHVQHAAGARSFGGSYGQPTLNLKMWRYANSTPNDTTGAWVHVGASSYSTSSAETQIKAIVVPSAPGGIVDPARLVKLVTNQGVPFHAFKVQVSWRRPGVNYDPLGYTVSVDDIHIRIKPGSGS